MKTVPPLHFRGPQAERTIAVARAVLAIASLYAIWLDPADPRRFARLTDTLQTAYVVYAIVLLALVWRAPVPRGFPIATHVIDIVAFSILQYFSLGPSSPFFVYFVFAPFSGALRWGWRGTLGTAAVVLIAFVAMAAWMSATLGITSFELNRFVIRTVYLGMVAWLLVYLGQHESQLRDEIQRLARWPKTDGDSGSAIARLLQHAAGIVRAPHATVAWETGDEPWLYVGEWSATETQLTRHPPAEFDPLVAQNYGDAGFVAHSADATMIHPAFRARLKGGGIASAAFQTDRVSGRAFFTGLDEPTPGMIAMVEVVVRELGASIGELIAQAHHRQIAIREERIRVARDLHDGVLQSMTGIRFELQAMADEQNGRSPSARDRLLALERALASEQRELRLFIHDLKPLSQPAGVAGTLAPRLEELRNRLGDEWKLPIALRVGHLEQPIPASLEGAVPLMVHEAIVNALKHAAPSKVTVDVAIDGDWLRIAVSDDGRGFAFRGRYDQDTLTRLNVGPVSLRERITALGGRLTIESSAMGSRVEIELPITQQETEWRSA